MSTVLSDPILYMGSKVKYLHNLLKNTTNVQSCFIKYVSYLDLYI